MTKSSARKTSPPACRRKAPPPRSRSRAGSSTRATNEALFASRNLETPAEVAGGEIRAGADSSSSRKAWSKPSSPPPTKSIQKVQRFIKPEKKTHKEVIINAESLETRVAVQEDGRLEEFTIERTTEERLVGSIFKGKVRNLEDGLKAAFVDIGFEKNAFLHYWDIVPTSFDSGVEVVEREGRNAATARASRRRTSRASIRPAAKSSCR